MFTAVEDLMLTPGTAWQGTSIGWSYEIDKYVSKLPIISERFCGISYTNQATHILAYTAYFPTSGQDEYYLEVLDKFQSDISNHKHSNSVIIIGTDTNQSEKSSRRRIEAMNRFKEEEFSMMSILVSGKTTFHHNNQGATSAIDTILFHIPKNSEIKLEFLNHLCTLENFANLSSHDIILGDIQIPFKNEENTEADYTNTYEEFMVKKPKWDEVGIFDYQEQTFNVISQLFSNYKGPEFIPALTEMISKTLVLSAEMNFDHSKPNQDRNQRPIPGFSKEHREAYNNHAKVCKQWRKAGRPQAADHPAKAAKLQSQRRLQKLSRQAEAEKAIKQHDKLMKAHANDINSVCGLLKQMRGEKFKGTNIDYIENLCGNYTGSNVLEGFCANTEKLCNTSSCTDSESNEFYNMCSEDNQIILELIGEEIAIPKMQLSQLKDILFRKLKLNKACDIFKLTVEHLRNCGDRTLALIIQLLNSIIEHLNYLSSPQLNTAIATIIHKGKGKSVYSSKSYRQVRVTPLIGRLLDEFLRPMKISVTKTTQNKNQYGFSEGITYMMGALQRHEVEKYCQDYKMTFFGCSLDGESAFEVVYRTIQLRELYCAGEKGEFWQSSKFSYENSLTQIKMKQQISRKFQETTGVKQGHINSSDNYKIYINPALNTLDISTLGVWVGPINVSVTGIADDVYLMSSSQSGLQGLIRIAEHYGTRYKIKYGADKTKITVVGSDIDMKYFQDTTPWTMGGENVKVVENNDHLGQVISGYRQEAKNIDLRIQKGRSNLYSLLGPAFAYKCLLSPLVKLHIFRTFTCPIIRSGLSSFALRPQQIEPISLLHRKVLKSILHLSKSAPTPAIHFLLGELPIEGRIHRDMFSLFFSVWCNPDTKIHQIIKYLLANSPDNSRTWAVNLRHLSKMYKLEDLLSSLQKTQKNYKLS